MTFVREQSFNCGRNPEYIDTVAYLAAKKGASLYIASSGSVIPNCNRSDDSVPFSREEWNPSLVPSLPRWVPSAKDVASIKDKILFVNKFGSSAERWNTSSQS